MSRVIDAHHHLWRFKESDYPWIGPEMDTLRRDHTAEMIASEFESAGIDGSIVVQARQTLEETDWLLSVANRSNAILGVVGWFPLQDSGVEGELVARLERNEGNRLVGVRHVVQDELDPEFILGTAFNRGVELLNRYGLAYDILVVERQLLPAIAFVDRHPKQRFVLDHIGKPRIAEGAMKPWDKNIAELARRENVFCKLSGMVTEARWEAWTPKALQPYMDAVFEAFGPRRVMFGSDWPVCLLASGYSEWYQTVREYCASLSTDEQQWVFGKSANAAYGIEEE